MSDENVNIQEVMQDFSELVQTIKGREDKATVDIDNLTNEVKALQEKIDAANTPVRKGTVFGDPTGSKHDDIISSGKFAGCKASDVLFANHFLTNAWAKSDASANPTPASRA